MEKIDEMYDVIVCGLGINGAMALNYLSENSSLRILGIEAALPGNKMSNSWGETRLLRYSNFDKPEYNPLIAESARCWREIQKESATTLFQNTELLHLVKKDTDYATRLVQELNNKLQKINPADASHQFPFLTLPSDYQAYLESDALILFPEKIISFCIEKAHHNGAHTLFNSPIQRIRSNENGVEVILKDKRYLAKKVLLTLGGWISTLFPEWQLPIDLYESTSYWFREKSETHLTIPFLAWDGEELYYGFPDQGNGVKAASYQFGKKIATPNERNIKSDFGLPEIQKIVKRFFPHVQTTPTSHHTYFLDMGPNENIIVGKSPTDSRLVFIAGGSGHGFKMAPSLAKAAIQALLTGSFPTEVTFLCIT